MSTIKIPPNREKNLRRLAGMMNTRHRHPFPITRPLLECFDIALEDEEVDLLLRIGTQPLKRIDIPSRSGMLPETATPLFERLVKKGFYWPQVAPDGEESFALAGIMLGWFEVFLSNGEERPEQQEFARRMDALIKSWGEMNFFPLRSIMNRRLRKSRPAQSILAAGRPDDRPVKTIPVDRTVSAAPAKIYPARTVLELVERHADAHSIAVVHCFCRQYHRLVGDSCGFGHPPQSCIAIGRLAHYAVEYSSGRYLSKEEALRLIRDLEAKGAIHQVFHEQEEVGLPEIAICNCCRDCCGVLGSYNRAIIPLNLKSYFEAQVEDSARCSGCGICVDHCPVFAISMVGQSARIDITLCIGCGQCELQCTQGAIRLVPHERQVRLPLRKRSQARLAT
ncbi:MAG: 4Fe-4S ferredoxin iron-sulfur binding domain protein [Acidobacteria bacterium]|nr:4Fe-4S ferredoxin iron-sulfur binding domain protein [Acidobacteriota bacterium]